MLASKNYTEDHKDGFVRLYYKTDKEKINRILDRLPEKYMRNLLKIQREMKDQNSPVMVRYNGYEFFASRNNFVKRLCTNVKNDLHDI